MEFIDIDVPQLELPLVNPTPYYSLDFLLDTVNNDIIINPDGTYALATGSIKLQQDIKLFILSPQGSSLQDFNWGNPAIALIGTAPVDPSSVTSTIRGAVATLKYFKDNEQRVRGYPLEGSELIGAISVVDISQSTTDSNSFVVTISCTDGTNASNNINIVLGP